MRHFSGYGAYLLFLALRTHFTKEKYDFFKFNGKVTATKAGYQTRRDKHFFEQLAKQYDPVQLRDFYISNLLKDSHYVTQMFESNAQIYYHKYMMHSQALTYTFKEEVSNILKQSNPFHLSEDHYPPIVIDFLSDKVSIQTVVILDDFLNFTEKFDKYYEGDVIWPKLSMKIGKYRPFLKYDREKMKSILKERINNT